MQSFLISEEGEFCHPHKSKFIVKLRGKVVWKGDNYQRAIWAKDDFDYQEYKKDKKARAEIFCLLPTKRGGCYERM